MNAPHFIELFLANLEKLYRYSSFHGINIIVSMEESENFPLTKCTNIFD
jgi:hypothetical protein